MRKASDKKADRRPATPPEQPTPGHYWVSLIFLGSLLAFIGVLVGWLYWGRLEESMTVQGQLAPLAKVRRVMAPVSGIVAAIHVEENEEVKKGQVLLELDTGTSDIRESTLSTQLNQFLDESATLQTAATGHRPPRPAGMAVAPDTRYQALQQAWLESSRRRLSEQLLAANTRVERLTHEHEQAMAQQDKLTQLLANSRDLLREYQSLFAQGGLSANEVKNFEQNVLHQEGELNAAREAVAAKGLELEEARHAPDLIRAEFQQTVLDRLNTVTQKIAVVSGDLESTDWTRAHHRIVSPVDGIVHRMEVHGANEIVSGGETLISIVPKNTPLVAEVQVPNQDMSFIYVHQPAALRLDAFPYQTFGRIHGEVVSISPSTISDSNGRLFYRVSIRPERSELLKNGRHMPLRSGMTLSADLITREKNLLSFFTEPVFHHLMMAFKDPTTR
ncbi:MAG: HlyD family type I secretion periplasmic adaptor subunit [Candidatus Melainabacteria bacterium]